MAVSQHQENLKLGCNYTDGAWSDWYDGHKAWCQRADVQMANLTQQTNYRNDHLTQCKKAKQVICDSYATLMTNNARMAREMNCGLSGGRFSENYEGHKSWCNGVSNAAIKTEQDQSNAAIAQCQASKTTGICALYASAMAGLNTRYAEICAGRDDFQYVAASIQQLTDECAAQSGAMWHGPIHV